MARLLTKLRIDEVSCVIKGANPGAKVLIRKSDEPRRAMSFDDIMKLREDDDGNAIDSDAIDADVDGNDAATLREKLEQLVAVLILADPAVTRQQAAYFILHTAHGRALFQHFSKQMERPMNRTDELKSIAKAAGGMEMICKNIIDRGSTTISEREFSAALMAHCKNDVKAFSKKIEEDVDIRRAYGIAKGYPNMMSIEPVSTEVGSTITADDSKKAYEQLMALAEKQHALSPTLTIEQLFARVFADPANAKLANAAHRRPQASSTSGDELQR
jgi:hypothetical protein